MMKEEILTIELLRESVFENRRNEVMLRGIQEYLDRNNHAYSLNEIFEISCMIIGAFKIYIDKNKRIANN